MALGPAIWGIVGLTTIGIEVTDVQARRSPLCASGSRQAEVRSRCQRPAPRRAAEGARAQRKARERSEREAAARANDPAPAPSFIAPSQPAANYDYDRETSWRAYVNADGSIRRTPRGRWDTW
jgi:hypothetical protein